MLHVSPPGGAREELRCSRRSRCPAEGIASGAGADVNIVDVVLGTMNVGIFKSYLNSITNIHNNALYWFVFPFRTLALMNIPIQWIGQGTLVPSWSHPQNGPDNYWTIGTCVASKFCLTVIILIYCSKLVSKPVYWQIIQQTTENHRFIYQMNQLRHAPRRFGPQTRTLWNFGCPEANF